ncbi:kinase-like domain-containing protein [Jimgerdemannia flammicorona]|uniref:Kinase-like domain-containing protein n=2 Tax=Jimgerdemannia flammicorona TaxID=994334 RepID=A0A433AIC8_9FUNG|nr:kinase-like domain-containing protein [Jimgerdemannia flammicorona]RUS26161.1 kinase-like domain-containing protein [Jimgerdemannia flammicorona]
MANANEDADESNLHTERKYLKNAKIGEGTYAVVYDGIIVSTKQKIAIKKIKVGLLKDGLDLTAIREVKFLQELKHPNIVNLVDVFSHKTNLNLVLEFLDWDLEKVIKDKNIYFMPGDIKSWMQMMLRGLDHCHKNWVLHRDMKPNNLLLNGETGELKIADFGLARDWGDPSRGMTSQVVTRWYRAPELLMGAKQYSYAVDIWSVGCIFAELMLRTPYFAGDSDIDQLTKIFHALGTPTEQEWQHMSDLPEYVPFEPRPKVPLRHYFTAASADTLDLLAKMLVFDPNKRITAHDALLHPYFRSKPRPTALGALPKHKKSELNGMPTLKRRASISLFTEDSEIVATEGPKVKRIARKLDFGEVTSASSTSSLVPTPSPRIRRGDSGYKSQNQSQNQSQQG